MESVWIAYTSSISQLSLWHYQTESFHKIVCWSFSYPSRNFLNILLKFGLIIKLINGHRGSNKFFQKIENIIETLIKILGQYFKKNYPHTKYLWVLTLNQPWNMELILDTFFLGNKKMQVGSFSKIKTCSWTYGINSLNRLKLEKYTKKKVNQLNNHREWLGRL